MEVDKNGMMWLGLGILLGILIIACFDNKAVENNILFTKPDTTYNKVKLDSIKVQVGKHDTTIYKLNIKLKDDVEKSYQLSDSAAIELFKSMSSASSKQE